MTNAALCVELWLMIFELIADDNGEGKVTPPILSVMLVCKAWKAVATPLLYRHLWFSKNRQPSAFLLHTTLCETAQYRPLHLVRSVVIHHTASIPELKTFIAALPELSSWTNEYLDIAEVDLLASTHSTRLLCLDTAITLIDDTYLSVFSSLQRLTALRKLCLWFPTGSYFEYADMGGIAPLCMPTLEHVSLALDPAYTSAAPLLAYFGRCRFDRLRRLGVHRLYQYEMTILDEFLKYHGPRLHRLDLARIPPTLFPTSNFTALMHLRFQSPKATPGVGPKWIPSSVCRAYIEEIDLEDVLNNEHFFHYILSSASPGTIKEIAVKDPKFCWTTLGKEFPEVFRDWVSCATRLQQSGVALLDKDGLRWTVGVEAQS